jgi:hypothetical protein
MKTLPPLVKNGKGRQTIELKQEDRSDETQWASPQKKTDY